MPLSIPGSDTFHTNVREYAVTDAALGGAGGAANLGVEDLTDRTQYLYNEDDRRYIAQIEAASGGRATAIKDDNGNLNVMARIPAFKPSDLDPYLGSDGLYHPAFYVNGVLKDYIYIGLFQGGLNGSDIVSQPGIGAELDTFSAHSAACSALGTGWHMMSIHEYSALALLSLGYITALRGNTDSANSHESGFEGERGRPISVASSLTYPGSGPLGWRHDQQPWGVADLVGNYSEFVNLLRNVDGKFYFPDDNYYTQAEASWKDQGFYYNQAGSVLSLDNSITIDNNTYTVDWDSIQFTTPTAITSTSLLCDLLLWWVWDDGGTPRNPSLIQNLPGLRTAILETGTHYTKIGGGAGDTTNAGLGYMNAVDSADDGVCRLAYIP